MCVCVCVYIHIITVLVFIKLLCGFVANQVQYIMESSRTGRDYPNDSITKNGQNLETSPGDLRRFAVTQTPVKNHQLILM